MSKYIYTIKIHTGYVGATHEEEWDVRDDFTEDDWDNMTTSEKERELSGYAEDMIQNYIEVSWSND